MRAVEGYLDELAGLLRVRGAARRRLLRECRDHLEDCAAQHGPEEAVRRFGTASALAAAFDAEIAARRARHSALAAIAGVLAVGGSTLALLNASSADASAVVLWAVVFFAAAQTSAVSAVLTALQVAAMGSGPATASDLALLCRRSSCALVFAGLAMSAAGGAVPGHASATVLLSGPAVAALAGVSVLRAQRLLRRLGVPGARPDRSPLDDLGKLVHVSIPAVKPTALLVAGAALAASAAYVWDRGDQGTVSSALSSAGIEAALVAAGFLLLGPLLGLWPRRGQA